MLSNVQIPERLQDELHGETPLFVVQEPRMMTTAGMVGGMFVGGLMGVGALFLWATRGNANTRINIAGIETSGDSALGMFIGTYGAALLGLVALAILVATPLFARRPGGVVVGTPTRLLRTWLFGTSVEPWRVFKDATKMDDGSIRLARHLVASGFRAPDDIVQPAQAAEVLAIIRERIRAPEVAAEVARAKLDDHEFRSTHREAHLPLGPRGYVLASGLILFGGFVTFLMVSTIVEGGTVTISSNGGPEESVSARDPVAWGPFMGIGVAVLAAGVAMIALSRPRAKPLTYVATSEALLVRRGPGEEERIPWAEFAGEVERVDRRGRVDLRLPLRREQATRTRRGTVRSQVVLQIVGAPADAQDALLARLAPTAPAA